MKRGPKEQTPGTKLQRGTFRQDRDAGRVELFAPSDPPIAPDWLTEAGRDVWLDDIGRVLTVGTVTELDSTLFATYCNMAGALTLAWRAGEVPPVTAISEVRKMQEMFGLAGTRSRIGVKDDKKSSNPFASNGR